VAAEKLGVPSEMRKGPSAGAEAHVVTNGLVGKTEVVPCYMTMENLCQIEFLRGL